MFNRIHRTAFIVVLNISGITAFAQPAPPVGENTGAMKDVAGDLHGMVIDRSTRQPVEFATIGLYNSTDSSLVTGTITDNTGNFRIDQVPFGEYFIDIRFMGYTNARISKISVSPERRKFSIGEISMQPSTTVLKEVEVVAERAAIEYRIDKKVVNVAQNIAASGGTAVDVLETVPSITSDAEGNIALRGSTGFTVLVDGKPTVFEGNDALQQIPASAIQHIEIITNPSARYDPDGTAGIINVIMKKNRQPGLNGIINLSAGTRGEYDGDINMSYKTGKLNLFGGFEIRDRANPGSSYSLMETYKSDTTHYLVSEGDRTWRRGGREIRFGTDYYLDDRNTISVSGNAGKRIFGFSNYLNYHDYSLPGSAEEFYYQDNRFGVDGDYYSFNLNHQLKFDDKGHELMTNVFYSGTKNKEGQEVYRRITDAGWNPVDTDPGRQQSTEHGNAGDFRLKTDYVKPLGESSKLETGYQGRYFRGDAVYDYEDFDPDLQQWIRSDAFSSHLSFRQNIQGAYLIFSNSNKIADFQVGLRTEYTGRIIRQLTIGEDYKVNRFDYFPSASISRQLPADQQVQASYSRRIERPRDWNLDPYTYYIDPYNVRRGNPLLEPEYTGSWELNYIKRFGTSFISAETYYRQTSNKITDIRNLRQDGIMEMTFTNLDKETAAGLELSVNVKLLKWWTVTGGTNMYHYTIDGTAAGKDTRSTNTWNMRLNNDFRLKWGTRLQLNGFYNGRSVTAQGERKGFMMASLGIRQDLLQRRLTLSMNVRDIFSTMRFANSFYGDGFYSFSEFKRKSPTFGFSLTYKINNYKQRAPDNGMNEVEIDGGGF